MCDTDPLQIPNFPVFEGQVRYVKRLPSSVARCVKATSDPYVGTLTDTACTTDADCVGLMSAPPNSAPADKCVHFLCPDSPGSHTYFACGTLTNEAGADFFDWMGEYGGHNLYVTGDLILPNSEYKVGHMGSACAGNLAACDAVAESAVDNKAARWIDVDGNNVAAGTDVSLLVIKVKDVAGSEPFMMEQPRVPTPDQVQVGGLDLSNMVDASKNLKYPFHLSCAMSTTPCATTADCTSRAALAPPAGDPDYASTVCSPSGYCTKACASDGDCPVMNVPGIPNTAPTTCGTTGFCTLSDTTRPALYIKDTAGMCQP
jgi:hypothetical protein